MTTIADLTPQQLENYEAGKGHKEEGDKLFKEGSWKQGMDPLKLVTQRTSLMLLSKRSRSTIRYVCLDKYRLRHI